MGATLSTGSGKKKTPEPEMNVTPLVDVVLVLLIIFMVVAPAVAEGEQIELPAVLQPDQSPKDLNPLEVTLALNGSVTFEKEKIDPGALKGTLQAAHAADAERNLLIKIDSALPYARVRETFAMVQGLGFKGVSLKVLEKKKAGG